MNKAPRPIYKQALGITTGDVVTTSYDTGPYIVRQITGPYTFQITFSYLAICPYPTIALVLAYADQFNTAAAYINNVHQEPNGQYLTDAGDEIIVEHPPSAPPAQMPLLASHDATPEYVLQEGVDYNAGDSHVWHCSDCGLDFNAEKQTRHCGPACPRCTGRFPHIAIPIIMMGNGQPRSSYVRAINA